jgi:hypothetical protein
MKCKNIPQNNFLRQSGSISHMTPNVTRRRFAEPFQLDCFTRRLGGTAGSLALGSLVEDICARNPTKAQECSLACHWDSRKFGPLVAGCLGDQQGFSRIQPRIEIRSEMIRPMGGACLSVSKARSQSFQGFETDSLERYSCNRSTNRSTSELMSINLFLDAPTMLLGAVKTNGRRWGGCATRFTQVGGSSSLR